MAERYQTEQSQMLNISSVGNQSISHDPFVHEIHNRYGIPLVQLQTLFVNSHSPREKTYDDESTELDYGQKLIINHNILKEMVHMIDQKPAVASYIKNRPYQNRNAIGQHKMDDKLKQVKRKLQELIQFIGEPSVNENHNKDQVKISDMNQMSYLQSSLQYSRDILDEPRGKEDLNTKQNRPYIKMEQSDKSNEVNRLHSAKQVTSQVLSDNWDESPKPIRNNEILKQSLQRISEVQSGQTIQRQSEPKDKKKSMHNESSSYQNSKILEQQELDQTGQLILSTINKKTTKISLISDKHKSNSRQSIPQRSQENVHTANGPKRSPFWKEKNNKLQSLSLKSAISHQSIEEPKAFNRTRFKFDDFARGFTFKSLENSNNELSVNSMKLESNQISRTSKPQFIRYDPVNNSISSSILLNSNHSMKAKNSLIKQSKIIKSFPSQNFDSPQHHQYIESRPKGMHYLSQQVSNEQLKETAHFQQVNSSALKQSFNAKETQMSRQQHPIRRQYSVPYFANKPILNKPVPKIANLQTQIHPSQRMPFIVDPELKRIPQASNSPPLRTLNTSTPHFKPMNSFHPQLQRQSQPLPVPVYAIPQPHNFGRSIDRPIIYQNIFRRPILSNQPSLLSNQYSSRDTQRGKLKKKGIQLTSTLNKPYY